MARQRQQLRVLWDRQRARVENCGAEQSLEYAFIQPVLESLGWFPAYQTFLQGRKPDYALFLSDDPLQSNRGSIVRVGGA